MMTSMKRRANAGTAVRQKRRNGDLFMLGVNIMFFIAVILIFWKLSAAYAMHNAQEGIGTRQTALLHTYAVSEEMLLYLDEAAKFSAYEALGTLPERGATLVTDAGCGQYATYFRWTADGRTCFPVVKASGGTSGAAAKDGKAAASVHSAYIEEVKANLRRFLNYPGLPSAMAYDITMDLKDGLRVVGRTSDSVVLPIVKSKNQPQRALRNVMLQNNIARVSQGLFQPDASIPGITVMPSNNRKERVGKITHIVILSTGTPDTISAQREYAQGTSSVHYIIDRTGAVIQVVPEDQRASFMQCEAGGKRTCAQDLEDHAIGIALVNAGALPLAARAADTPLIPDSANRPCAGEDPTQFEESSMQAICDRYQQSFAEKGISVDCAEPAYREKRCWQRYTKEQLESLSALTADIARKDRRAIPDKNILLGYQVSMAQQRPGPALHGKDGDGTGSQDPLRWYADFTLGVIAKVNEADVKAQTSKPAVTAPEAPVAATPTAAAQDDEAGADISMQGIAMALPSKGPISSCYGDRKLEGGKDDKHDGLDFGRSGDDNIYAMADGVVEKICGGWTGSCACSTKDPSCKARCTNLCSKDYGNYVLLRHPPSSLYTRYSHLETVYVREGQRVKKDEVIGKMGNTGSSEAKHLDFKIYTSATAVSTPEGGSNPLCFFPEEELTRLRGVGASCRKYDKGGGITRANKDLLAECQGTPILTTISDCSLNLQPGKAAGDKKLTTAIDRIMKLGIMDDIKAAGEESGIDYRLLIAQIAHESVGNSTVVSFDGGVGISQFTHIGATKQYFAGIASPAELAKVKTCGCRDCATNCRCDATRSTCDPNDPRLDPAKSVRAQAKYIASNIKKFEKYKDKVRFGIAYYNAGKTYEKVKEMERKLGSEPTWEQVLPTLDHPEITGPYVEQIMARFYAQGGSAAGGYADQDCGQLEVKELGSYTFNPSFSVEVPDALTAMQRVVDFAEETHKLCDGSGDKPVKECLDERLSSIGGGLTAVKCEDDAMSAATEFMQFVADCSANKQDACACPWRPSIAAERNISVQLRGEAGTVSVDGIAVIQAAGDPVALFRRAANTAMAPYQVTLKRALDGGVARLSLLVAPVPTTKDLNLPVTEFPMHRGAFLLHKEGGKLAWLGYENVNVPVCGAYKTTYPVCVQYAQPIPRLSTGRFESPIVKFALQLDDKHGPKAPTSLSAMNTGAGVQVSFTQSASKDTSYYNVSCRKTGIAGAIASAYGVDLPVDKTTQGKDPVRVLHADAPTATVVLTACDGLPVEPAADYEVIVVPFDIAANQGSGAAVKATKPQQSASGTTS